LPFRLALAVLGVSLAWAVGFADTKPPDAKEVDADHAAKMARGLDLFKKHVRPVLVQTCVKCHGGKADEGELDLTDRRGLLKGGEAGPAVIPGKGKDSLLYKLIPHAREPHMPHKRDKLSDEVIAQVAAWIDCGAPYDEPLVAKKEAGRPWTEAIVSEDARQ